VNLTGSLLLGVLVGAGLGPTWGAALAVGFSGASTTWSTLALDVVALASERAWWPALLDLVASGVGGLLAVAVGVWRGST
jgi:CrcB protein